ncbi:SgcJ/EcaC family oxidoreductase [Actinomadura opuntiae]|uniref:SgcJ/EcaC family oxidoreductase n=1 Tax=Actinomadura sp. OS1-43 TaxID=604315 RepID=UPI00255AFCBD|nr:SgcJ/EcaC family oxidoreductase [Actinomadura sp. OS1-43]MDL4816914.1 SgcJ/EcaC family oxidoreductase [Actinomadura sp. OS1-43]
MDANESEVRSVLDRLYKAWADNDADAFADLYVEDATVVMPGVFHQGRSAVRDFMAQSFAGPLKGSRAVDEPQDVRVDGDTAVIVSNSGIIMAGQSEVPPDREVRATWVLARRNGEWLISAYTNTPVR